MPQTARTQLPQTAGQPSLIARVLRGGKRDWGARLLAFLAGVYLVLAAPISIPGGYVERVQANLVGLNLLVLLTRELPALLVVLLLGALVGAALYAVTAYLAAHSPREGAVSAEHVSRWGWLKYALPMLLIWGLYLLAFYPAMMSGDSFNQWRQARTGQYETGHPLLHTLYLWFWMQLWDSPALVAVVQVLALALLTAWGLGQLRSRGLPEWAAWSVSALFALSPVNGTMAISIWKDIPYSIAVFGLSLLILLITLDERFLARRWLWLALGITCVVTGLFRLNGILIIPVVLPLLALLYRRRWKVFAAALALFALVWIVVQYPLPALLRVQEKSVITGTIALHHIAAHLYSGTQPTPAEREVLEKVMPLEEWGYYCYSINPLQSNPALNKPAAIAATGDLYRVALNFFLRHPTVDVQHTLCASSLVYRIGQTEEAYLLAMQVVDTPYGIRYLPENDLGFEETPILPGLTARLIPFLRWTNLRGVNALFWRPAVPLYLLLWIAVVLVLRARTWKVGLFLLPALIQTAGLFATNISQSFRYQYAVYLVALFALALLAMPVEKQGKITY